MRYLLLWLIFGNILPGQGFPRLEYQVDEDQDSPVIALHSKKDTIKFPPCQEDDIPHYTAHKISSAIQIDGKLDEDVWIHATRSSRFRDLISGASTMHDTWAAVLWDDDFLYVGYWIEEPNLQATLTERDAPIYTNNDVELFIAGEDAYYEFEINAYGTIYEVLFIWEESYTAKGYRRMEVFDLERTGVRFFHGVGLKNHPRGKRIGFWNWDLAGLQSAVFLDGTINDDDDRDRGWTVELALPWSGMGVLALGDNLNLPPQDKDVWRMDFSRFNQYKEAPPANDSGGWAWSPHGVWDSHVPECFTYVHFSERAISNK
ncbi:MAG: carbohydrate-binding family 9-like protein [Saprospiraceae bacterium]|nr:carbohydrate-binding family 9-like protein [Saprospiraceae bacterium]